MAMTYNSLVAPKGTPGSVANWVNYTKLDIAVIVDEAQALLWQFMRTREMRNEFLFTMPVGTSQIPLPVGFLDPMGDVWSSSQFAAIGHLIESDVRSRRVFSETSGFLGANPFTTAAGSALVSVAFPVHGFNQGSSFFVSGATAVGGLTPNGTFLITSITDANTFVIDCSTVGTATSVATGGGSIAAYTCGNLQQGSPRGWSIWDNALKFDFAFIQQQSLSLLYYKSPPLLSVANLENFVTQRYPHLMRKACQAAAADFMKDTEAYQSTVAELKGLIQGAAVQDDLTYRGVDLRTETPGSGGGDRW